MAKKINSKMKSKKNFKTSSSFMLLSIVIGIIGAVIVSSSSFYTVLKFGALPWASVMVALISTSTLGFFKKVNGREVSIVHTIMSAGAMVAGGVAFTMPGYLILGGKLENIDRMQLWVTVLFGSILGCIFSFIFKQKLLESEELEFPIGEATFNVINSGENSENMTYVGFGALLSTVIAILRDFSFMRGKKTILPTIYSFKKGFLNFYVSPLLLGIGYILGIAKTFAWFLGGALIYFIFQPFALIKKIENFDIMKNNFGMGIIVGFGIAVIVKLFFSKYEEEYRKSSNLFWKIVIFAGIGIFGISWIYKLPVFLSFIVVIICIFCIIISGYTVGKTGLNFLEIYAVITILTITFFNKLLNGIRMENAVFSTRITTLMTFCLACFVTVACGLCGNILNNLKLGSQTKIAPSKQFFGELIGAAVGSFVVTNLFFTLFDVYKNIGPHNNADLMALQASFATSFIDGIPFIQIFWLGALIGFVLYFFNVSALTFGIGIYVPFYMTLTVFLGGILNFVASRVSSKFSEKCLLVSNGLMIGEAIVGVGISLITYYFVLFQK